MVRCLKRGKTKCLVVDTADDCVEEVPLKMATTCGIPIKDLDTDGIAYEYVALNEEYYLLYGVRDLRNWRYHIYITIRHKHTDEVLFEELLNCPDFPLVTYNNEGGIIKLKADYNAISYPVEGGKQMRYEVSFDQDFRLLNEYKDKDFETGFKTEE